MSEKKKIEPVIGYGVVRTFPTNGNDYTLFYDKYFSRKRAAVEWAMAMWGVGTWKQAKREHNLRIVRVRMEVIDE